MSKVIMTSEEYISRLKQVAERKTYYRNKYPDNLLYIHQDGRTSGDCLNTIKALLNGYDVNVTKVGYYQRDLSNTGDVSEPVLLSQCTEISSDFDNIPKASLLYMKGHVGSFVGNTKRNGKEYNVIECTKSFGGGVVYSWVDTDGTRRSCKGGAKNGKWVSHGLMSRYISYIKEEPKPEPEIKPVQKVYYVKKGDTLTSIAKAHGMSLAKLVSYNPQIRDINKISIGQVIYLSADMIEEFYTVKKGDTLGSIARQFNMSLNKLLGLNPDIKNPNLIHVGDKIRIK